MKNRPLFLLLRILLISLLFSPSAFSQDTVVRVVPSSVASPRVGQQFTVDIAIENGRNVAGYQVMLHFDRFSLQHVETQPGNYLPANAFFGNTKFIGSHGTVLFAATASPQERSGNGTLATLTFEIMEVKTSTFHLSAANPSSPKRGTILSNKDVELSFPRLEGAEMFQGLGQFDLVVESPHVSDATLSPGAEFTLSVTVRNRGGGVTPLISLYYYQSVNDLISARTDTQVGFEFLSSLGANKSDTESITLTAPTTPGTYYYGACAGIMHDEANQGNNCSDAVEITVTENQRSPGVVVESMSASTSTVSPDESFTLTAIVANRGTQQSSTTDLVFYRSGNDKITTTHDTPIRTVTVSSLGPPTGSLNKSTKRITLTAPSLPGVYYYGACVNVNREGRGETDCSDAVRISVERGRIAPDLVIEDERAEPSTVTPGEEFKLYATLKNNGLGVSTATTLRYYRSSDATISKTDTQLRDFPREALAPTGELRRSLTVTAPTSPGVYYYGVCVDAVDNETDTGNNCSGAVKVTVESPTLTLPPDFISDVAYGQDFTYFVLNAQFPTLVGVNDADVFYGRCTIKVDLPGVPDKPVSITDKNNARLDNPGYFMVPLATPRQRIGDEANELAVELVVEGLGLIPIAGNFIGILYEGAKTVLNVGEILKATADPQISLTSASMSRIEALDTSPLIFINPLLPQPGLIDLILDQIPRPADKREAQRIAQEGAGHPNADLRFLFFLDGQVPEINIEIEQTYFLVSEFASHPVPTYTATYAGVLQLKDHALAAPSAQPMSLTNSPVFQLLPSETQAYLLQHFGTPMDTEAWQVPEETALLSNYPNPFNPETWIPYQLAQSADVRVTIYDIHGRVVQDIDLGHQRAGIYQGKSRAAYWDGKNASGEPVASGVYFYTLKAGDFTATRKMLIRK